MSQLHLLTLTLYISKHGFLYARHSGPHKIYAPSTPETHGLTPTNKEHWNMHHAPADQAQGRIAWVLYIMPFSLECGL